MEMASRRQRGARKALLLSCNLKMLHKGPCCEFRVRVSGISGVVTEPSSELVRALNVAQAGTSSS